MENELSVTASTELDNGVGVAYKQSITADNARNDSEGNRVLEGHQVDVGHHYESMSRREFDLPNVNVSKSSSDPD